jgi:Na+/proline symporter
MAESASPLYAGRGDDRGAGGMLSLATANAGGWAPWWPTRRATTAISLLTTSPSDTAVNVGAGESSNYSFITICSTLAWGLGYFGMPQVLLHFMAAEDENKLKISRRIGTVWVVISMAVAVTIGIVGYAMSKTGSIVTFAS